MRSASWFTLSCHTLLTSLVRGMENSKLKGFILFPPPVLLSFTMKKNRVFFPSIAKKKKLKLYECYKYYMLRHQHLGTSRLQGEAG